MQSVGIGYDLHPLKKGRKLVLGGIEISYHLGLSGYSDADVLMHAVADALLGAARMGDIGVHFPSGNPAYYGVDSAELLRRVGLMLSAEGWSIDSIDTVIVCQQPRLSEYILPMRMKIASCLNIAAEQVGVKATTTEGLGPEGEGKAISAQAVALANKKTL